MKPFYLIAILIVSLSIMGAGCKTKKPDSGNTAGGSVTPGRLAPYSEDAHRLALREELSSTHAATEGFDINSDRAEFYFQALTKISAMFGTQDDLPAHLSEIHTQADPSLREVRLVLDPDSQFKDAFSQKRTTTPDLYMNQILTQNRISIREYQESSIGPQVLLYADKMLNAPELANALGQFKGIKAAEAVLPMGDGNDITSGSEGKNAFAIRFSIGAGDCPSGCIYRKFWVFYVTPEGEVSFQGTRGELPEGEDR